MVVRTSATELEAYPYDPNLPMDFQRGLDRLRCVADRNLAANLLTLFELAERNTAAATDGAHELETRRRTELQLIQRVAARAFDGELGAAPEQLAESLLLGEAGERDTNERSLREFAFALRQLKRISR